jgi:hypothetical protein
MQKGLEWIFGPVQEIMIRCITYKPKLVSYLLSRRFEQNINFDKA